LFAPQFLATPACFPNGSILLSFVRRLELTLLLTTD
jgi:hypothetical protein